MDRKKILIILSAVIILAIAVFAFLFFKKDKKESLVLTPEQIVSQAINLSNAGQFEQAEQLLLNEIGKKPSFDLKLTLASIYLDKGMVRGTEEEASQKAQGILIELEKENKTSAVYTLLGKSYEIIGNFDKAIEYYEKSAKDSPETLYSLGHAYYKKGDSDKAFNTYREAEKLIKEDTDNSVKANIYGGLGNLSWDYSKAEQYFLKSIELSGSSFSKSQSYSNLANLKLLQKDNAKAFEYAQKALEEDSSSETAHVSFAKAGMSQKDILENNKKQISESLLKAILLAPRKVEPQYWQGKFDFVNGKTDMAIKSFEAALSLIGSDSSLSEEEKKAILGNINLDIAVAYHLKKDNESVKKYMKEALLNNPVETMYILQNTPSLKEVYDMLEVK